MVKVDVGYTLTGLIEASVVAWSGAGLVNTTTTVTSKVNSQGPEWVKAAIHDLETLVSSPMVR